MPKGEKMTDKEIQGLKPKAKQYARPVGGVHGLMIRVSPGGTKSFSLTCRPNGQSRRIGLGRYPDLRLKDARERALILRGKIANGTLDNDIIDKNAKNVESLAALVELYIDTYCRPNTRDWRNTESRLRTHVLRKLGDIRPERITRRDLSALLSPLAKTQQTATANRVHAAIKGLFAWAVREGYLKVDPAASWTKPYREVSRDRVLSDPEIAAIWRASEGIGFPYGSIVQMLFLTGKRRQEVANIGWSEVDLDTGHWTLPAARTKNGREHTVQLGPWALEILREAPKLDDTFVFPSRRVASATAFSGFAKAKRKLDTLSCVTDWRLHDIRRTFSTHMAQLGIPLQVVEKLLTHTSGTLGGVAGIYNRYKYAKDMNDALVKWECRLSEIVRLTEPAT